MKDVIQRALVALIVAQSMSYSPEVRGQLTPTIPPIQSPERSTGRLTFNKDVAPIVFQYCANCHRPGQAGPFNLLRYTDLKKRAKQVVEVVERRYMPPWLPERGVVEFTDERGLSVQQIATIRQWVEEGAAEGSATDLPPLPSWTEGWRLGAPDLVVKLPKAYTLPADGKDIYRNFVVPIPVSRRRYVRGVEFLPGNWRVVHHAFINVDATRFSRRKAEKENPPGFDGMLLPDSARMPGGQLLGWQPGKLPYLSPEGLSWILETNTDLVLQLHLQPSGKPETVQPMVGFYFTDKPPTNTAFRVNLNPLIIDIPAGAKAYEIEDGYALPIDVTLVAISPHAHYLAKRMHGYAVFPDGTRRDLLLIKEWDFNWQGDYRYARPIFLPKGTTLAMHFSYDNSADNPRNPNQPPKRVRYGLQTTDEMGELWFQVVPRDPSERNFLAKDFYGDLARRTIAYNEYLLKENPNDAEAHTNAGRAKYFRGQSAEALDHLQYAIKANPNYDRAYYELGFIYLRQNRLSQAEEAFKAVVRLNPDDYEAHGSLGVLSLRKGDFSQAESHFRTSIRLNPDDEIARANLERVLEAKAKANESN